FRIADTLHPSGVRPCAVHFLQTLHTYGVPRARSMKGEVERWKNCFLVFPPFPRSASFHSIPRVPREAARGRARGILQPSSWASLKFSLTLHKLSGGVRRSSSQQKGNHDALADSFCARIPYRSEIHIEQLQSLFVNRESRQEISIISLVLPGPRYFG